MSDQPDDKLMRSLKGIKPLRQDKIDPRAGKPRAAPRLRPRLSNESHRVTHGVISVGQPVSESWFNHGLQNKRIRAIRSGQLAIDISCDLHGYTREHAERELRDVLDAALKRQARLLLIIHGKGYNSPQTAVIKPLVLQWLSAQPAVLAWCPATPRDGGSGATYVYLKRVVTPVES